MPRRISPSQIRSRLRQAQSRSRAAAQKFNSEIRAYNRRVERHHAEMKRAIDKYKREVRAFDSQVRANRERIDASLSHRRANRHSSIYQSATKLSLLYEALQRSKVDSTVAALVEREAANSLSLASTLLEEKRDPYFEQQSLTETRVGAMLESLSTELGERWIGAVFALSPNNPDAARHFCTSAREIIANIIDSEAPDGEVLSRFPDAELTEQGTPTRREKIRYCLERSGKDDTVLEDFWEANVDDLTVLFRELNAGAHGPAGKYSFAQLTAIKTRVEDAIGFVCTMIAD